MLRDHFHPPLNARRGWRGFHSHWASRIAASLNRVLPDGWFAEDSTESGVEIDVGISDEREFLARPGGVAPGTVPLFGATAAYEPPEPVAVVDFATAGDTTEVRIYDSTAGPVLAGSIEIVGPANKDRPQTRSAFVSKCENHLRLGIGCVVVDTVTRLRADLHAELLARLAVDGPDLGPLHAASYRPALVDGRTVLAIFGEPLRVGGPLPVVPLYLKNGPCVAVDLPATYVETGEELRLPAAG